MKFFLILSVLITWSYCDGFSADYLDQDDPLEPFDNIDEQEFEELFDVPEADTIEEQEAREEALKEHETEIHEANKKFLAGKRSWYEGLNEFSNIPDDELDHEKTGSVENNGRFYTGLIEPEDTKDLIDERSELYFKQVQMERAEVPDYFNAVEEGLVTPVKSQGQCGSCVAFATMAGVETCFKKQTGNFGDYSEQQFVDCGYDEKTAWGCDGAYVHSYMAYGGSKKLVPSSEEQYPYLNNKPLLTCPADVKTYDMGAKMETGYYTYRGDEETLKKLVYKHGAVVTSLKVTSPFYRYKGGVYKGCEPGLTRTNHAVTIVGYGTENGEDYWLIKNSWGTSWGMKGYMKIKRGEHMCAVGFKQVVTECSPTDNGSTSTTQKPCEDKWKKCPRLAETSCWKKKVQQNCQLSCGLCEGMTRSPSLTCYNKNKSCDDWAQTSCYKKSMKKRCKKACGFCEGMAPHPSATCFDKFENCAELCDTKRKKACKKSCGLC